MNTTSSSSSASSANRPLRRLRSHWVLAVAGLLLLGGGGASYLATRAAAADETAQAPAPVAPAVTVATVEVRTVTDHRELLGRVDAAETVEIRPRVSGHIEQVRLKAGQLVNKGEVLFVIDPRWYRAQFDLATAHVARAQVRTSIAEREAQRSDQLLAERAISAEDADTRTSHLAEARAELLSAEAALATARLDLEHTEVRAPIGGRVSRAFVTAGNLVSGAPGAATLLTSIVSVGDVFVYADVDEATVLVFNRLGREGRLPTENGRIPVEMQLTNDPASLHRGYVESTDNRLEAATGTLVVRMVFPDPEGRLVPGLSARARLPISAQEPTLFISERAIGTDQSQKFVLTVGADNTVAYRAVKLGPVVQGQRIIREGVSAGERVIVNGLQRVRPGMTVTAQIATAAESPASTTTAAPAKLALK